VLGREKFAVQAAEGRAAAYVAALLDRATIVEVAMPGPARAADADNDHPIELASVHGVDAVVPGDRHLLAESSEPPVLTPRERVGLAPAS
jgi:hypothetical protein